MIGELSNAKWVWNSRTGRVVLDETWAAHLGLDTEPACLGGLELSMVVHRDDLVKVSDHLVSRLAEPWTAVEFEFRALDSNGKSHRLHCLSQAASENAADSSPAVNMTVHSIAEPGAAEEEFGEDDLQYRLIFSHSPTGLFYFDPSGIVQNVNDKFAEIIGASRDKLLGFDLLNTVKDEQMLQAIRKALAGGLGVYEGRYHSVAGDKTTPIRAVFRGIHSREGHVLGGVCICEDVTERHKAEQSQKQLVGLLSAAVDATRELMALETLDAVYRRAVELARERLGIERCGLHVREGNMYFGTYGTSPSRETVAEHHLCWGVTEEELVRFSDPDSHWVLYEDDRLSFHTEPTVSYGLGWQCQAPIRTPEDPVFGLFTVDAALSNAPFDPGKMEVISVYCSLLGGIIHQLRMRESAAWEARCNEFLASLSRSLMEALPLMDTARLILRGLMQLTGCRVGYASYGIEQNETTQQTVIEILGPGGDGPEGLEVFEEFWQETKDDRDVQVRQPAGSSGTAPGLLVVPARLGDRQPGRIGLGFPPHGFRESEIALVVRASVLFAIGIDHRLSEEALRRSESRNKAFVDAVPDLMFLLNADGIYLDIRSKSPELLYRPVEEIIGRKVGSIGLPAGVAKSILDAGQRAIETREVQTLVYEADLPSGRRYLEARMAPSGHDEVLAIIRDITSVRKAEEERHQLEAQILQAQKLESMGIMAGGIAHDFNNLLVGILGTSSLARTELPEDSPVRPLIEQIEETANRAAELTHSLLAYSGKGRLRMEAVDLGELVREMVPLLRLSMSKRATIEFDLAPELPPVRGDTTQLRQVVMNLLTNASEALNEDQGTIRVKTGTEMVTEKNSAGHVGEEAPTVGVYVYLEVADTGVGMDEATRKRIFDPFFTTKFTGRGLGLAAVLGIVKGHEGFITVSSMPGSGTTFRVLFPPGQGTPRSKEPTKQDIVQEATPGGTVLVIDDEKTVRTITESMLGKAGYTVLMAKNGEEGLAMFRSHQEQISAVLLDLTMPGIAGEEVLHRIRSIHTTMPVLLMSGFSEADVLERLGTDSVQGFISKPFRYEELIDRIRVITAPSPAGSGDFPVGG